MMRIWRVREFTNTPYPDAVSDRFQSDRRQHHYKEKAFDLVEIERNNLLVNIFKKKKERKKKTVERTRSTVPHVAAHVAATVRRLLGAVLLLQATNYRKNGFLLLHYEATKQSKKKLSNKILPT